MADLNEKNIESTGVESSAKAKKPAKDKKPNIFVRIGRFFRDCISEMKKVTWLSGKETWKSSLVVLVVVIALSVLIGVIDTALEFGILGLYYLF